MLRFKVKNINLKVETLAEKTDGLKWYWENLKKKFIAIVLGLTRLNI